MGDQETTTLLAIDIALLVVVVGIFVANRRRHKRTVEDAYSQTIAVRLALVCLATGVLFFINFVWLISSDHMGSLVQETVSEFISGVLEGVVLMSFFTLMVVQVGGTKAAIAIFASRIPDTEGATAIATTRYSRYRQVILVFALLRPILAVLLGLLSLTTSPTKYVRMVLAVVNVVLLAAALICVIRTLMALKTHIPDKFALKKKFIVIKLILMLATIQWTIYTYVDDYATEESHLKYYWSVSLAEVCMLSGLYYSVSSPATHTPMGTPPVGLWRLWDVTQHPVPEYTLETPLVPV
ncbi:hypothetical protein ACHHYP_03199 [Achlya hypogyna]|uniref:Transmembrane protein n=1 Tax=Achlya hypogyna TaxID=1202772 RepID=A0A1V9Z4F5_ACHHY|nr:hypothetical protein ACHHYP_03199 [Achlya hypogyna]